MPSEASALQKARSKYVPKLPNVLKSGKFEVVLKTTGAPKVKDSQILAKFPHSSNMPLAQIVKGDGALNGEPLTVGVVLSGGQAPGGHNVIAGLLDALKAANPQSRLLGFTGGPKGAIEGKFVDLTPEFVEHYRNTGGFDMIGSGRDKIEKPEDLEKCTNNLTSLGVNALVIIGGDDSNTNAAVLAEYLLAAGKPIRVIGVPKTIDGDMKNKFIEASFGFDTAAKTYAELVGNICRDAMSARKYWHFVKLMGRAASHVTLEVALQTRPNLAIISEEVEAKQMTLKQVVDQIVDVIVRRNAAGKNYGVVVIPEGLVEFMSDFKALIRELEPVLAQDGEYLKSLPDHSERRQYLSNKLSAESARLYASLPEPTQAVLLTRDKHGNVPVSQVETDKVLIDLVGDQLRYMQGHGAKKIPFSPLGHFFGYEGRCVAPTNFDADYTYALGYSAAQLIRAGLTGYTVSARSLVKSSGSWKMGGIPVTSMLNMEMRKGKPKPVIRKALVELDGGPFMSFAAARDGWVVEDEYLFPGPVQYFGPPSLCHDTTITLKLEHQKL